jgi:TolB-like protein
MTPGAIIRPPERPALPLPDRPSLAVLPFENLSGDPEQGYFADGIVEDITTALARMRWLFVTARNSSFTYKGRAVDVKQVGRELGVRYVLEGSVRKAGERVRITGQLIDALSGAHIWAERFDGTLADVFELQDRVAEGVTGAIEPTLRGAEIERARRKPTGSLDAYDLYLRALPHLYTPTAQGNREALRLLERALALDPGYAVALGLKAWCHLRAHLHAWAGDDDAERTAGEHAARRALASGRDDPTALAMGGFVLSLLAHDHEAGLAALDRAVALNPNSALALSSSALVSCFAGDYGTAIEHGRRALRLSPFDPLIFRPLIAMAFADLFTGRFEAAAEHAARAIQANPGFDVPHTILVASLVELGRPEAAREAAGRLMAACPSFRIARRRRAGFRDAARFEAYLAALRRAGLPD